MDGLLYAAKSHFKLEEEGPEADFFVPLLEKEKEDRRQDKYSKTFQEPKVKWNKSQAKQKLYELITDGVISDTDNEEEDLKEIYLLDVEFAKYDFGKFKERLSAIRDKIQELNDRAADDLEAFEVYKSNHKPALFSHKGYIQWQGSDAQEHLWDDLADGKVESMKPEELRLTRTVYQEFPLFAFRSKIYQEIRTAKYLRILREQGKQKKAS